MRVSQGILIASALALGLASACSRGEPKLIQLRSAAGPDEFAILPTKPIEVPKNLADLPPPAPGSANRTDPTPLEDAARALGGRATPANQGIPGSDSAIVNAASRYGVTANVRETLAAEDYAFRDKNRGRPLERLFGVTTYFDAYAPMSLDRYAELDRLRRLGIRTPAAPPPQ